MPVAIRFQVVKATAKRVGACPACGKKATRSRTFEQTVNPFNRDEDGQPKSPAQVRANVQAEADAWQPDPDVFMHAKCAESGDRSGMNASAPSIPATLVVMGDE